MRQFFKFFLFINIHYNRLRLRRGFSLEQAEIRRHKWAFKLRIELPFSFFRGDSAILARVQFFLSHSSTGSTWFRNYNCSGRGQGRGGGGNTPPHLHIAHMHKCIVLLYDVLSVYIVTSLSGVVDKKKESAVVPRKEDFHNDLIWKTGYQRVLEDRTRWFVCISHVLYSEAKIIIIFHDFSTDVRDGKAWILS